MSISLPVKITAVNYSSREATLTVEWGKEFIDATKEQRSAMMDTAINAVDSVATNENKEAAKFINEFLELLKEWSSQMPPEALADPLTREVSYIPHAEAINAVFK